MQLSLQTLFGIKEPKIAVAGLNPHAGEQGSIGHEDQKLIAPLIAECNEYMNVTGPHPADTLFTPGNLASYDAFLAMYHDQGLPVIKYASFGRCVNITLGLPILRTSVDHGTALDLAGTGKAEMGSLKYALETAINLSQYQLNSYDA